MCDAQLLSKRGVTVINRCAGCRCIYIWNHNLILTFSGEQFASFRKFATELDFDHDAFPFPDAEDRVVMRTPLKDIQLTFTRPEWLDFNSAMEEAGHMLEVYALTEML